MSIRHDCTLNPVTAVAFYENLQNECSTLVLVGESGFLKIFNSKTSNLIGVCKVFDTQQIHGIVVQKLPQDEAEVQVVVWGGRSYSFLTPEDILSVISGRLDTLIGQENKAQDWLLDATFSPPKSSLACAFLTAHCEALMDCLKFSPKQEKMISLPSPSQSMLYSAHIVWDSSSSIVAAAGTVFGEIEIIVWKFNDKFEVIQSQVILIFTGHEGSIFGVRISPEFSQGEGPLKRFLASCSDDRTIRIWDMSYSEDSLQNISTENKVHDAIRQTGFGNNQARLTDSSSSGRCVASVIGHASRIWQVRFLFSDLGRLPTINVLSFGEDATVIQWDLQWEVHEKSSGSYEHGKLFPKAHFAHHEGKHIWSADVLRLEDTIHALVTGGADGRVNLHSIHAETEDKIKSSKISQQERASTSTRSWSLEEVSMQLPRRENVAVAKDDTLRSNENENELSASQPVIKRERSSRPLKDTLNRYAFASENELLTTTSSGRILLVSLLQPYPWRELQLPSHATHGLYSYSVLAGFPSLRCVFLAGSSGFIFVCVKDRIIYEVAKIDGKISGLFAIQSQPEGNVRLLVTALGADFGHVLSIQISSSAAHISERHTIRIPQDFIVSSVCEIAENLVVGFRNGALAHYNPTSQQDPLRVFTQATTCITDAVTAIVKVPDPEESRHSYFLTTARDGTYSIFIILEDIATSSWRIVLKHQTSPPFGPMIENAWFADSCLYLYGFRSKSFVVWNESEQKEVMNVECGGAHRSYAYVPSSRAGSGHFAYTKASKLCTYTQPEPSHKVMKRGGHGREIKACDILESKMLIATGSEDTNIRIWSLVSDKEVNYRAAPETRAGIRHHTAGIQQVQWSEDPSTEGIYLFSGGGNEEFYVWAISEIPGFGLGVVLESTLSDLSPEHDLRIMSFDIKLTHIKTSSAQHKDVVSHIVVLGLSDSTIRAYLYSKTKGFRRVAQGEYTTACITQLLIVESDDVSSRLLTTSTDGHIALWTFTMSPEALPLISRDITLLSVVPAHQSAILSLSLLDISAAVRAPLEYLLTTGGDDGRIVFTLFREWRPVHRITISLAHAAVVSGVWTSPGQEGQHFVYTVGGDQSVKRWTLELEGAVGESETARKPKLLVKDIEQIDQVVGSVADAAGLVGYRVGKVKKLLVFGVGMEFFTVD